MATAIMHNTTAVWSYGVGHTSSIDEDEEDWSTPVAQLEASRSSGMMPNDDEESSKLLMEQQEDHISPSAWWTYGVGEASSADLDCSLSGRFTPIVQPGASKSSGIMSNDDEEESSIAMIEQRQDEMAEELEDMAEELENLLQEISSPTSSTQSSNKCQSPLESKKDEETGDYEDFELPLASPEDDEETFALEETSDYEDFELPLAPRSPAPPTPKKKIRRRHSLTYCEQWDNLRMTPTQMLSKMMPEQVKEAQAIIKQKEEEKPNTQRSRLYKMSRSECRDQLRSSLHSLDMDSSPAPPTPKKKIRRRHSLTYCEQWDNLRMTPTQMLSKMMPEQVKEAQAIIKQKEEEKPNTQRSRLYKMSRSECRDQLRSSLHSLDMDSGHTAGVASVASWSDSLCEELEAPALEGDKKKWGVKSLFEDLQKGTKKKKKKKKSTTKKGEKKNETDELPKSKKKKGLKRSKLEKSSSAPDSLDATAAASLKAVKNELAKRKKDEGTKRSSSSLEKIGAVTKLEAKKKKKSKSSDRTKDKKKKSKRRSSCKSGKTDASGERATMSQ